MLWLYAANRFYQRNLFQLRILLKYQDRSPVFKTRDAAAQPLFGRNCNLYERRGHYLPRL